jgi:hypothetical protein
MHATVTIKTVLSNNVPVVSAEVTSAKGLLAPQV